MLSSDDMFDMMREMAVFLSEQAILASIDRPLTDQIA